jgi:hypothetical protein
MGARPHSVYSFFAGRERNISELILSSLSDSQRIISFHRRPVQDTSCTYGQSPAANFCKHDNVYYISIRAASSLTEASITSDSCEYLHVTHSPLCLEIRTPLHLFWSSASSKCLYLWCICYLLQNSPACPIFSRSNLISTVKVKVKLSL